MNVVGNRKIHFTISGALVLFSLLMLVTQGLNFGIDFSGGTLLERGLPANTTVGEVQQVLASPELASLDLGGSYVQPVEDVVPGQSVVVIRTRAFEGTEPIDKIDQALSERFGEVSVRRTELVGPVIGQELVRKSLLALLIAGAGILLYISFRFEYRFGIAAVLALSQDVLVALGIVSLLGRELNTPFIAAVLTIVGYSINNTIVVFDRIRENQSLQRRLGLAELVNASVNQTLARSINTSLTTLFAAATLYLFGGSTIKDFTLTLLIGVVMGTYTSIFVAGPLYVTIRERTEARVTKAA